MAVNNVSTVRKAMNVGWRMITRENIAEIVKVFDVPFPWAIRMRLEYLEGLQDQVNDQIQDLLNLLDRSTLVETILLGREIEKYEKGLSRVQWLIADLKWPHRVNGNGNGITDARVERARNFPLEDLIERPLRGQNVRCPFHGEDRHPSASIKGNFFYCFTCGRSLDPIGFVMATQEMTFPQAVKFLNERR